ncbi:BOLA class I histocompatibility antigen, alpha chain BL3-7-like [Colossoma macropomum]|uniref:BOLA class I histocompatibility antigen, alpha chain BL3-7-like n=1 Tax=Colossoma macropomum TaxID=42526 RepID=UPI001863E8D9|nr:BOLA class I histocompatibility antigen, alpha chain BL3-7-like [Colossoma macropomum]
MDYCTVMKKSLFILTVYIHPISAVSHSLQYVYTAVTPGINFPEFTAVGLLDGKQIDYYDSNIRELIPKTDWIKKTDNDDPEYWNTGTQGLQANQEVFKANVAVLMQRFNQTEGVHTVQMMYGCEQDGNGNKRGYWQYGYDGEDFISLDVDTLTWTAANAKAVITKHKWETVGEAKLQKTYLEENCTEWLQKYVEYGRSTLERKVSPEVSLFQKDSSSPVVCHATGFFPKAVNISWQKNGEDLHEDVELGETLPNQEGTFQKRSVLTVPPEELNKHHYTCIIQHSNLDKKMVLQGNDRRVVSGVSDGGSVGVISLGVVVVLLLVLSGCSVYIIWKNSGVHTVQEMYGCELHDGGSRRGHLQFGYDGEDYISLDVETLSWTAANAKAVITKYKWEKTQGAMFQKAYLENTCVQWLGST